MKPQKTRDLINTLKNLIRHEYAWPGGYQMFAVMDDGAYLCPNCCRAEYRAILSSTKTACNDGFRFMGFGTAAELECREYVDENPEQYSLDYCANCNLILNP